MTILETLKKLHKKMTGKETGGKSTSGILTSLEENYTGGGNTSPSITYEPLFTTTIVEEITEVEIPDNLKMYNIEPYEFTIPENAELYFESENYPLTKQILGEPGQQVDNQIHYIYGGNITDMSFEKPCYDLFDVEEQGIFAFISTETFEIGDTITILKKVNSNNNSSNLDIDIPEIPEPNEQGYDAYKGLRISSITNKYELAPIALSVYIWTVSDITYTSESIHTILDCFRSGVPIEVYMELGDLNIQSAYHHTFVTCQAEKFYYDSNDINPYKFTFSYYDENETTKRKYITLEGSNFEQGYGETDLVN